jgi:hypothetical protein
MLSTWILNLILRPAQLLFEYWLKHFKGLRPGYKHAVDQKCRF